MPLLEINKNEFQVIYLLKHVKLKPEKFPNIVPSIQVSMLMVDIKY